jgi:hypothetical protein
MSHRDHFHIHKLKEAVKGLADKGRAAQVEISHLRATRPPKGQRSSRELHGISIQGVVAQKRSYGVCSRYHQLAYAFVRGVPYRRVERKTHPGNAPSASIILEVLTDFSKDAGLEHVVASVVGGRDVPAAVYAYLELVRKWLEEPPAQQQQAA